MPSIQRLTAHSTSTAIHGLLATIACALALIIVPAAQGATGEFEALTSSPQDLTSVAVNPATNLVYGQQNEGSSFYSYDPRTNAWSELAPSPIPSGNNGGATYLNGKIYTVYTNNSEHLGVYDIASNTWTEIPNPLGLGTADITTTGEELFLVVGTTFVKYDPTTETTTPLASAPTFSTTCGEGFEAWGGLQAYKGEIYGDAGNGCKAFAVYDIASDTWTELPELPEGAPAGSAIDPVSGTYFAYGDYGGHNLYSYDIASSSWTTATLPFAVGDGALVYVSLLGKQGIYIPQGEEGTGFIRYITPEPPSEPAPTPVTSTSTSTPAPVAAPSTPGASSVRHCVVPKMRGLSLGKVRSALAAADCTLGNIAHHYNAVKRGELVEQSSHQGTILPAGSLIGIWLSLGRPVHSHHKR